MWWPSDLFITLDGEVGCSVPTGLADGWTTCEPDLWAFGSDELKSKSYSYSQLTYVTVSTFQLGQQGIQLVNFPKRAPLKVCATIQHCVTSRHKTRSCICGNKDGDQLCINCTTDQCLCFRFSFFFSNPKFQASRYFLWLHRPVCVTPGHKPRRSAFFTYLSFHFQLGQQGIQLVNFPQRAPLKASATIQPSQTVGQLPAGSKPLVSNPGPATTGMVLF